MNLMIRAIIAVFALGISLWFMIDWFMLEFGLKNGKDDINDR
jgi:hypothetical protein